MLPLGGQARPKGGYVTLHGLCAKLPVPAQTLTILRHITNFFARHTPHSHTHLDADITTFSLGDDASPCCFFAKPPDIAWFICHYHQACHTLSGLAVYSESARALLLIRLRPNTSKKKKKNIGNPLCDPRLCHHPYANVFSYFYTITSSAPNHQRRRRYLEYKKISTLDMTVALNLSLQAMLS
jgi:hypothetical protein